MMKNSLDYSPRFFIRFYPHQNMRRKMKKLITNKLLICINLVIALFIVAPAFSVGNTVGKNCTLSWDEPVPAETDVAGYKLHIGTAPGAYTRVYNKVSAAADSMTCLEAGIQTDGQYYVALTVYDKAGNEGGFSNELPFVMDSLAPAARGGLKITMPQP